MNSAEQGGAGTSRPWWRGVGLALAVGLGVFVLFNLALFATGDRCLSGQAIGWLAVLTGFGLALTFWRAWRGRPASWSPLLGGLVAGAVSLLLWADSAASSLMSTPEVPQPRVGWGGHAFWFEFRAEWYTGLLGLALWCVAVVAGSALGARRRPVGLGPCTRAQSRT